MANETARHLRRNKTSAERRLWGELRALKPLGFRFRQQVPIDHYIVDFACLSKRLIIEVDGATHSTAQERERDAMREAYLRKQGFRIMRVWNREIFDNVDGVMDSIIAVLNTPTPNPSPQGGGEPSFSPPSDGEGGAKARGSGEIKDETLADLSHCLFLCAEDSAKRDLSPPLDGEGGAAEPRGWGGATHSTSPLTHLIATPAAGEAGGHR